MILIKNGLIKTMAGADIENGCVLIGDNGKILEVGKDIVAENAQVIDAQGRLVTPGLVEAHCHIGIENSKMRWEGADYNEKADPITPHLRAIDGVNPMDESLDLALQGGVTCACTCPGSTNVVAGTVAIIKLAGNRVDDMIVKESAGMKVAFGENPKNHYGQMQKKSPITRMGVAGLLREVLFKTKYYMEQKESGKNPAFDMKLEAMIPVLKKQIPLNAHAHRADDIFTVIRIAKEFDILLSIVHCTDGSLIADHLGKENYPAFVGPALMIKNKIELSNKSFKTPNDLYKKGVKVSITTDSGVVPLQYLGMCAGLAVSAGLPMEEGWKAVTINPASSHGIADRVGSLEVGKDADVVVWTADPLTTIGAEAFITIVDGKIVYQAE